MTDDIASIESSNFDVLIIGGGLVGASLACALELTGKSVAIIEAYAFDTQAQPSYDDRTVALSYGSKQILDALGLWSDLSHCAEAIKTIHISDRGHFGVTRLKHTEEKVEALGYVAQNRDIGQVLYQRIQNAERITLFCPAKPTAIEQSENSVLVTVEEGGKLKKISAQLVVAADGVSSPVRQMLQIGISEQDYRQSAVITNVTPGQDHQNVAYERFTDTGPIAFLPMTDNRCSVVWTVPSEQAENLATCADDVFLAQLQERFGYRLGQLQQVGKRHVYPLVMVESTQVVRGRVVVVGNAAHSLHPVAGQGFNLALRDVTLLAELISEAEDSGSAILLQSYVEARESDAHSVFRFTDTLVKTFSNRIAPLGHLRAAGLLIVDLIPPAKHLLAKHSMGLSGNMSSIGQSFKAQSLDRKSSRVER